MTNVLYMPWIVTFLVIIGESIGSVDLSARLLHELIRPATWGTALLKISTARDAGAADGAATKGLVVGATSR